ncbi:MAG TPA: J domain-containing protein [Candidatus Limnocylindrales bacterium]|nr:J domain-containing protein [Candidatus Limnocylindrales bacterium]
MAFGVDPHRVLGLAPGASAAEIKRAYRRLAKAFHPDAAGEAAIPRFLAIQAAYDQLMGPMRSGGSPARRPEGGRRPGWWADPERARATRGRRASSGPGAGSPGASAPSGSAGSSGSAGASRAGRRASGGEGTRPGDGATAPRTRRGNRQPGRATPGSTTYDEADVDPFDPEWSGGSWYGTTSGTYWTINPKEYADPRKHGPEYQARGRRRSEPPAGAWGSGEDFEAGPGAAPGAVPRPARRSASAGTPPRSAAGPPPPDPLEPAMTPDPLAALPLPEGAGRRVAVALVGWPPLGIAIAWLLGELSGCGRFSAGCVETFAVGTWLAQFAVLGVLLLIPPLAAASAVGTLAMLAVAIPASILLSAVGGAREPGVAAGLLAVVLAIAWLAGAAFAVGRRSRTIPP